MFVPHNLVKKPPILIMMSQLLLNFIDGERNCQNLPKHEDNTKLNHVIFVLSKNVSSCFSLKVTLINVISDKKLHSLCPSNIIWHFEAFLS
jgi:hypothetical protein